MSSVALRDRRAFQRQHDCEFTDAYNNASGIPSSQGSTRCSRQQFPAKWFPLVRQAQPCGRLRGIATNTTHSPSATSHVTINLAEPRLCTMQSQRDGTILVDVGAIGERLLRVGSGPSRQSAISRRWRAAMLCATAAFGQKRNLPEPESCVQAPASLIAVPKIIVD